jgi:repressor LexA
VTQRQKQDELLEFIRTRLKENGFPPSYEEMKLVIGLRSRSSVHRLVWALVERGLVVTLPTRARAIRLTGVSNA